MATVYSGETQIGTYIKARVCVEYSGTSATCWFEVTRTTGSYSGYNGYNNFTFNGVTNRVYISNVSLSAGTWTRIGSVKASISLNGGNYAYSQTEYSYFAFSGTVRIPSQAQAPTNLSIASYTPSHNSVTISSTCSGMRGGTYSLYHKLIEPDGAYFGDVSRYVLVGQYSSNFSNVPRAVIRSSTCGAGGCLNICGGIRCRVGVGLEGAKNVSVLSDNFYLPLAPIASCTQISKVPDHINNVWKLTYKIKGAACDGNFNATSVDNVSVQYRLRVDPMSVSPASEQGVMPLAPSANTEVVIDWTTAATGTKPGVDETLVTFDVKPRGYYFLDVREYYPTGDVYTYNWENTTTYISEPDLPAVYSPNAFVGSGGVPTKVNSIYVGVNNVPQLVKAAYVGEGGVPIEVQDTAA